MPVHPIGEKNRKGSLGSPYAVKDYYGVNPEFGTLDDLKAFVAEAHRLGLHVNLDWVANHTAGDNPLVKQHPDWYERDGKGEGRSEERRGGKERVRRGRTRGGAEEEKKKGKYRKREEE